MITIGILGWGAYRNPNQTKLWKFTKEKKHLTFRSSDRSVQNHGWLFDIGDDVPTQLYGDYFISQYKDPVINQSGFNQECQVSKGLVHAGGQLCRFLFLHQKIQCTQLGDVTESDFMDEIAIRNDLWWHVSNTYCFHCEAANILARAPQNHLQSHL